MLVAGFSIAGLPPYRPLNKEGMGRCRRGEFNSKAKLSEEQVMAIWARRHNRKRGDVMPIAKEFGVNESTVRGILNGTKWTHLTKPTENENGCEEERSDGTDQ